MVKKQTRNILLLLTTLAIATLFLIPQSPFSVTTGTDCNAPVLNNGATINSYNELRSLYGVTQSNQELEDAGFSIIDGAVHEESICPQKIS